jgi:hypothetical protein
MMKYLQTLLAVFFFFSAPLAVAKDIEVDTPMAATTLQLADRHASLFFTVDKTFYKVVFAFSTGMGENEQLIRQTIQLADGQTYQLSIGGYGINEQASTISMTRKDDRILTHVVTCKSKEEMTNCI